MKKIYIHFYSAGNFGDDFFIKLISKHFPNVQFELLINPKYKIQNLPANVKVLRFSSWIITICNKIISVIQEKKIQNLLQKCVLAREKAIKKKANAVVYIGGSIFMEKNEENIQEQRFSIPRNVKRDYSIKCKVKKGDSNEFVIGANFGPYYREDHLKSVTNLFNKKCNVCLRDYSSYKLFEQLENVQYAPDVVFSYEVVESKNCNPGKSVVISVIAPEKKGINEENTEYYYDLMKTTIEELRENNYIIDLVSLCDNEGDRIGISKIVGLLDTKEKIRIHYYTGNIEEILSVFEMADFVIGARFHSIILGFLYNKPVFPISYNCKTDNYLLDLDFLGKYARLDDLEMTTVEEVLFNLKNNILCTCDIHKKYAKNQFYALEKFLNEEFDV